MPELHNSEDSEMPQILYFSGIATFIKEVKAQFSWISAAKPNGRSGQGVSISFDMKAFLCSMLHLSLAGNQGQNRAALYLM